ncbi:MAG: ATP-binding protein [Gammaproteobacteria bacterium]
MQAAGREVATPSSYKAVTRAVLAAVAVVGAVLLVDRMLGIPLLNAENALFIALFLVFLLAGAMWWNVRTLERAERRVLQRDRLYAMLSQCNQAIVHAPHADALLPEICRIACAEGKFALAWVGWLQEIDNSIRVAAQDGATGYLESLGKSPGESPVGIAPAVDDPVADCIRRGEHVVVNDLGRSTSQFAWRLQAKRSGFGSMAVFPIRFDGRVTSALAVYARGDDAFARDDLRLLDEVASDVSLALDAFKREALRREAEESLHKTTHMLQTLVDASPLAIVVIGEDSRVMLWSPAAERMFGWSASEALGEVVPFVPEGEMGSVSARIPSRQAAVERRRRRKDGTLIDVNVWSSPLQSSNGTVIGSLGILADVTERRRFERQIRQSQKLDALGTIAGGIAHDFNNILTVMRGNLSLAQATLPADHAMQSSLAEVDKACTRAASLVRQILTFGGRQEQSRTLMTMQPAVNDALQLLRSTIPAGIEINASLPATLPTVMADSAQIHQVILNLGINASHALDSLRGRIDVALEAIDVDDALAATCPELHVGRYVRLVVADNGIGMSRDTLDRIFEPFFTTKAPGRGTGLGLAVVRGIVKNHDGAITVSSELGKGTRFSVYFPVVDGEVTGRHQQVVEAFHGNGERVLFLDDEEPIVLLASRMLNRLGYKVEAHTRAADALEDFRRRPGEFDLVLTDLSMPGASGLDFARSVLEIRPEVPVIMTTGYIDPDDLDLARRIGVREVILKPTTIEEMARSFHRQLVARPAS